MTVNTSISTASYIGNGVTTGFPVPFYWLVDTDIKVSQKAVATGVVTVLTLNSDYTLTGAGDEGGGSMTLAVAPLAGDSLYVERDVAVVQQTAYPTNGPFPASSHERALDRLTMIAQELKSTTGRALIRDPLGSVYDLGTNTLINGGTASNPTDIPTYQQVQGLIVAGAAPALAGPSGASFVGFLQSGVGASSRTVQAKLRERVSVKDFGAIGDGSSHPASSKFATLSAAQAMYPHCTSLANEIDSLASIAARNYLQTGTELQGGTIYFPRGYYKMNMTLEFDGVSAVTNYYVVGEGMLNTTLDFGGSAPGVDGILFNGGSQVGVKGLMLTGATGRGVVLNDSYGSFVSFAVIEDVRVQSCGGDNVHSKNSYLVSIDGLFSSGSVGGYGVNFTGNHTSIVTNRMYASHCAVAAGIRINGAVYIDVNAQSDNNFRGYQLSNVRGGFLRAPGHESNVAEGILLQSSDVSAANILAEYQNIEGLVIVGGVGIRNNTGGPLGVNGNFLAAVTADNRPISFTLIGCVDSVTVGEASVALNGASGAVTMTDIDCKFAGSVAIAGTVERRNLSQVGRSCMLGKSTNQSVPNSASTAVTWDGGIVSGQNSLGAAAIATGIVIPAGVTKVHVGCGLKWTGSTTGARFVALVKNGSYVQGLPQARQSGTSATQYMTVNSGRPIGVAAGDVISVNVIQDSGAALNLDASGIDSWLTVEAVC